VGAARNCMLRAHLRFAATLRDDCHIFDAAVASAREIR